jgi:hypothetical protein
MEGRAGRRLKGCRHAAESASRTAAGVAAPPVPPPLRAPAVAAARALRAALRKHAGDRGGHPRAQADGSSATTLTRRRPMARRATRAKSLPKNRLNMVPTQQQGERRRSSMAALVSEYRCTFWGDRCTAASQGCPNQCNCSRDCETRNFAACYACPALSGIAVH